MESILLIGNQEVDQMAQPQLARITCDICNGWYDTDRALRDHMQTVHRRFVPEQSTLQRDAVVPASARNRFGRSNEEWARLSVALRNSLSGRFNSEELDAIDRFVLLASQGSVFDHLFR